MSRALTDLPSRSWLRTPMAPEHPFEVYRLPVSYYVDRLRRGEWFSYSKINHGFWEYEQILRALPQDFSDEDRRRIDAQHGRRYCLETGFRDQLIAFLGTLRSDDPDLFFATSHIAYPESDRIEGVTMNPASLISCMAATLPEGFVPHDGMLWKAATISGEIHALYDAIRPHSVVVVGPEWLAGLQQPLGLERFESIAIHPREARLEREAILARILRGHAKYQGQPVIYLFQAATLAPWLVGRLHGRMENACLLDLGRALDICDPKRVFRQSWGRVFRRPLSENMHLRDPRIRDSRPFFAVPGVQPWAKTARSLEPAHEIQRPIPFAETKPVRTERLRTMLASASGALSRRLEDAIGEYLQLPHGHRIVLAPSAKAGLDCLAVLAASETAGKSVRWCVSAFGDPDRLGGAIEPTVFVDCDEQGRLDPNALAAIDPDRYDAVLVTNPFGLLESLDPHETMCRERGKRLVCDGSAALDAPYRDRSRMHELISFAHEFAWGAGELAGVLVPRKQEERAREILRSGSDSVSEMACARILDRLADFQDYSIRYHLQYARVARFARKLGYAVLGPEKTLEKLATPASVPLLVPRVVSEAELATHPSVVARKRHLTLASGFPLARQLGDRMVAFPCHPGLETLTNLELAEALEALRETSAPTDRALRRGQVGPPRSRSRHGDTPPL